MFTSLSRIIKYGLLGFWRNGWLSTATISIIIIALIVSEGLILFRVVTETSLGILRDKIDISIFFKDGVAEDEVLKIQSALESLTEVKSVEYTSKDKALEAFQIRHKDEVTISQALEAVGKNPLLASLNVKAYDPQKYAVIAKFLNNASFKDEFQKVTYAQNAVVIERLGKIIDTTEKGGWALIIFLAAIAILVTFNTIRLAIYSSREEIGIMSLVGASNAFIRGPYIVEGIIYGAIGAVLSVILVAPAVYFIAPYLKVFIPEMNLWMYFIENMVKLLGYQLLFGVFLGVASSTIAVRKYLRV